MDEKRKLLKVKKTISIPAVEGDSHADYYSHIFVNRLHAVVSHTSHP